MAYKIILGYFLIFSKIYFVVWKKVRTFVTELEINQIVQQNRKLKSYGS